MKNREGKENPRASEDMSRLDGLQHGGYGSAGHRSALQNYIGNITSKRQEKLRKPSLSSCSPCIL